MSYLWITLFTVLFLYQQTLAEENVQLSRQKHIFDLYLGVLNGHNLPYEHFDIAEHINYFHDPEIVHEFLDVYQRGLLPIDGVFTLNDKRTEHDTILLFKLFYSAKDFATFYKTASWARKHLHAVQFVISLTMAVFHRKDCHHLIIPPLYEILPNFFTPVETMHEAFTAMMLGYKEGKFPFNNTGYVHNYHPNKFGGPLSPDAVGQQEYKVSYMREDVGLNTWFVMNLLRFPNWMNPHKYGGFDWFKRGESMYYVLQQLFAVYTLQRLANKLPYTEPLEWEKPIRVGYNPRVSHINGRQLFFRPDHVVPHKFNMDAVKKAEITEYRLLNGIQSENIWDTENATLTPLDSIDGTDMLSRMIFGMPEVPNGRFWGDYFNEALKALAYVPHISSEHELVGNALSLPFTTLRDPVFYQFLNRLLKFYQEHKKSYPCYTPKELGFHGVHVKDFDVDHLITYFEPFNFEVTNAIPLKDFEEHSFYASQKRLNHKPYTYNVVVKSEIAKEAMIRVFIGPKYDADGHLLTLEQSRLAFVEIDRFPVKLSEGENKYTRESKDSPLFSHDPASFRELYHKVTKALKSSEGYNLKDYYYTMPERFQLPKGKKHGQPFVIAVIVTPYAPAYIGEHLYAPFGSPKYYDTLPLGFPFDRPVEPNHYHVPNILFKDILVYHKEEESDDNNKMSELI
ncbi:hypothetical protein O3M35_009532 [Rhynocoris fuscipes]|uniref:Uncharacterized protein n=1 Tax=Rhynocoris fuscipes TaxID=488301 RepID=A0AAW1D398_9HEMI